MLPFQKSPTRVANLGRRTFGKPSGPSATDGELHRDLRRVIFAHVCPRPADLGREVIALHIARKLEEAEVVVLFADALRSSEIGDLGYGAAGTCWRPIRGVWGS
jgi:hypothetical protein